MKLLAFYFKNTVIILLLLLMTACGGSKKTGDDTIINLRTGSTKKPGKPKAIAEREKKLQMKYANYLNTSPDSITNFRLYTFIDYWLHTPYLFGGTTKAGIDCSSFIQQLLDYVYDIKIPRTTIQQIFTNNIELFSSKHYLQEGDLIFFTTTDDKLVSHVGLYLGKKMFVNSASSSGVSIANMDNYYWKIHYVAAGRVIVKKIVANK